MSTNASSAIGSRGAHLELRKPGIATVVELAVHTGKQNRRARALSPPPPRTRPVTAEVVELRASPSAAWYNALHPPERREWLRCLPAGGSRLRIIARLRSGYADIGRMLPYREETRCPHCGAFDTVEHLLLRCVALICERGVLFDFVALHTAEVPSLSVLLGFAALPTNTLRLITTATAKFAIAARRWPQESTE